MSPPLELIVRCFHTRVTVCTPVYELRRFINLEGMTYETVAVATNVPGYPLLWKTVKLVSWLD